MILFGVEGIPLRGLTVWLGMGTFDISPPYVKLYGK